MSQHFDEHPPSNPSSEPAKSDEEEFAGHLEGRLDFLLHRRRVLRERASDTGQTDSRNEIDAPSPRGEESTKTGDSTLAKGGSVGAESNVDRQVAETPDQSGMEASDYDWLLEGLLELGRTEQTEPGLPDAGTGEVQTAQPAFDRLGRFRVHEILGQGGFGVVLRADDTKLNRAVAIKVARIQYSLAGTEFRDRFRREAQLAAMLGHPHIATVYESGHDEGGDYLVTELIEGTNLADWLAAGNRWDPRTAAAVVADLADAIEHAHRRGVLHRDLKPSNVLLQVHSPSHEPQVAGADGKTSESQNASQRPERYVITDFGLATLLDQPSELTHSGRALGTPAYAAPEQIEGDRQRIGVASDVYGLGAILYEALTGQPPFQGSSFAALCRKVTTDPPAPPRTIDPRIPRDLDAICMKCLEKSPSDRYSTAYELERDLRNFVEHRPVTARRSRWTRTVARWYARHPGWAWSFTALGVLLIATSVWATAMWLRSESMRDLANQRRGELAKQVAETEAALDALSESQEAVKTRNEQLSFAVEELLTALATSPEIRLPVNADLRKSILNRAEEVYRTILAQTPDEPQLMAQHAESIQRLAHLHDFLGSFDQSIELYQEAIRRAESVFDSLPELRDQAGLWSMQMGTVLIKVDRNEQAEEVFERGLRWIPETVEDYDGIILSARAYTCLAGNRLVSGHFDEALLAGETAKQYWDRAHPELEEPIHADHRAYYGRFCWAMGQIYDAHNRLEDSRQMFQRGTETLQAVDTRYLLNPVEVRYLIAVNRHRLGIAWAKLQEPQEARLEYEQSIDALDKLVLEFPDNEQYSLALASALYSLAITDYNAERFDDAKQHLEDAVQLQENLIESTPERAAFYQSKIDRYQRVLDAIQSKNEEKD